MKILKNLYFNSATYKYYDYPVEGGWHRSAKTGTTVNIWHIDGTRTVGYMCGEKHYTLDLNERDEWRSNRKTQRAISNKRAQLMKKLDSMSVEELTDLLTGR